jgi:hypothetical protein
MDDKEQKVITFKLSAEETEALDAKATAARISRSDYLRMLVSAPPQAGNEGLERLLRQLIYIMNRTHMAVYSIAEDAGLTSTEDLQKIYTRSQRAGIEYLAKLPERIAAVDAELKQTGGTAAPAAEKAEA